jgi:DivIVA domain-containing protein
VTSQGQRFRRRALRRGYKVDEVDSFLDRVEATLAGDPLGAPVSAQEVHDVVFRVRFGGYDEWQVDLHLDRVERQLGELEERGGFGRGPERGVPERMGPPMHDRMGPPLPPRPMSPMPAPMGPPQQDPYGRYDQSFGGGYDDPRGYDRPTPYDAFEPGRHGKMDMTAEIRLPDREAMMGPGPGMGGGPPMGPPGGMSAPGGPPLGGPPLGGPSGVPAGDLQRIDMLRRTFQPRRFGSGYDPVQVDRLFEGIITAMAGRGPMPISEAEIDTARFGLVPGGYFEAEVDAALKEVRDILRRR